MAGAEFLNNETLSFYEGGHQDKTRQVKLTNFEYNASLRVLNFNIMPAFYLGRYGNLKKFSREFVI